MANGFSQYQQSQLGVSAAKARAISERSQAGFRTGLTAIQEKEALERAADELEKIGKEAERNAAKRGRRASFGRLIGSIAGFAIGGPAGKAALGTALGGLAGSAAAGGLKSYAVDVPDSLVPGGIFYGRERDAFTQRAEDLEDAFDDLTKSQRMGIAKDTLVGYLAGRGLGKLGEAKIGDLDTSLNDFLEMGQEGKIDYTKKDYLKDTLREAAGGIGEKRMQELIKVSPVRNITPTGTAGNLMGAYQNLAPILDIQIPQEMLPQKTFEQIMEEYKNPFSGTNTTIDFFPSRNKKNSLFQSSVGPIGGTY